MTSISTDERVEQLLARAHDCVKTNDLSKAHEALKEASQLAPQSAKVKNAWTGLQAQEENGDFLVQLRAYLQHYDEQKGQQAVEALKQRPIPSDQAIEALDALLVARDDTELVDTLTGLLLTSSQDAGKALASRFSENATTLFRQLYTKGDDAFRAFSAAPFNDALWRASDVQKQAQIDLFRLAAAKLMDANVSRPERCMRYVARQMTIAPDNVRKVIDDDVFDVVLSGLDIRLEGSLRSQAILATSKILEVTKDEGEAMFGRFLASKVARQINDDLIVAFSAASAVFPIIPAVAARLFMTDGFVQQLVPNLERNSEAAAAGQRKSRTLEKAALELLSAACVDKSCRTAIDKYCSPWLRDLAEDRDGMHTGIAALILAKINAVAEDDITSKLTDLVLSGSSEQPDQAVEGLAYTSLRPKIKEDIAANKQLLASIVTALKERQSAAFGCLTIISNLTSYRPVQSEEQKKMKQLKAYANSSKPEADDPLDNDRHVTARAAKLLEVDVVPALVACCKQTTSPTNVALVATVLLSLSKEQKHRPRMTREGAVRLLLQIRDRIAKTDKSSGEASAIERNAAHALARLLISVNPSHVFTAALPATSAVGALLPLLSQQQDSEHRNLLPTFESLLALTNLASMEDNAVRDLQIRSAWDQIEELMFSSNALVQRASVELVCNLMASPSGVAKFADGSSAAGRRMHILLAMADVEDAATRRAAGGALAMLTEWDAAVTAVLDKDKGIDVLLDMCADDDEAMRHRGFACLLNLVSAPGAAGARAVAAVREGSRVDMVKDALRKTKNAEILGLGVDVLKKIA